MGFFEFFRWGLLLQAVAVVHFIRPPAGHVLAVRHHLPRRSRARSSTSSSRWYPTSGCSARCTTPSGGASASSCSRRWCSRTRRQATTKSSAICMLDEQKFARAKECYDKAIGPRSTHLDPVYRRGIAEINLGNFAAAVTDLETVTDPRAEVRLASSDGAPGPRVRELRADREGAGAVHARDRGLHALGDLPQLRHVPRLAEPERRSPRVGRTHPRPQGDDASLSAASRAPVVSQGQGLLKRL